MKNYFKSKANNYELEGGKQPMDAKTFELTSLAMLNELKDANEEKEAYKIKAEKLDKVSELITKFSNQFTVIGIDQNDPDFYTNATVQNVLFNLKLIINKEEPKIGNKDNKKI